MTYGPRHKPMMQRTPVIGSTTSTKNFAIFSFLSLVSSATLSASSAALILSLSASSAALALSSAAALSLTSAAILSNSTS